MNILRKNWIILAIVLLAVCTLLQAAVVPKSVQTLELKPGWNLVTLTRPIVESDVSKFLDIRPMTLDADRKCYVLCASAEDLRIGVGYWVFAGEDVQPVELTQDLSQTSWETVTLSQGWNLLGVAENSDWQSQSAQVWQWLNGHFQKISKTEVTMGEGYWSAPNQ